jgi:hypothetical protein
MSKKETNSNFDNLLYLYSVLKRLNCGEVDTFEQRITSQKTQYFAQLFGVTFRYNYNLYINGPYSPALAKDLFAIKEQKMKPMLNKFVPDDPLPILLRNYFLAIPPSKLPQNLSRKGNSAAITVLKYFPDFTILHFSHWHMFLSRGNDIALWDLVKNIYLNIYSFIF